MPHCVPDRPTSSSARIFPAWAICCTSSSFTQFLQRNVPEALKRRALRKLWRLDPVFANLDGLNNYDEDYTKVGKVVMPELRSIYRVGRGMILGEDPANEAPVSKAAESQTPVAETAGSGSQAAESPQYPAADPKTSAATLPAPKVAARAEASAQPDKPSATAALPRDEDEAGRGGTDPAGPRRRHAVSRRWGESSR
jgi:hypothetical protein